MTRLAILGLTIVLAVSIRSEAIAQDAMLPRTSYADVISTVQPKMVKIFGSGGLRNLESYQSGFLISPDGFILTAWSYVLDTGQATVILNDGRRFTADLVGNDPRSEIALLKIEGTDFPHFDMKEYKRLNPGTRVLAFSNLYGVATGDEPTSVLHGIVSGVTKLAARRGAFETPYRGDVYILDAMPNNAGAAGGALTDSKGNLAGMLGKELRDAQTQIWLNYSLPVEEIRDAVQSLLTGDQVQDNDATKLPEEYASLDAFGIVLIPNILRNTPPFIDMILPESRAASSELRADDLIVLVNGKTVSSQGTLFEYLREVDAVDSVRLTVVRGNELIEVEMEP